MDSPSASVVSQVQEQARATREHAAVLGAAEALDPAAAQRLMVHPLPFWIERMTTSYLRSVACGTPRADDPQPGATVIGKEGQPMSGAWSGGMGMSTLDVLRIACRL